MRTKCLRSLISGSDCMVGPSLVAAGHATFHTPFLYNNIKVTQIFIVNVKLFIWSLFKQILNLFNLISYKNWPCCFWLISYFPPFFFFVKRVFWPTSLGVGTDVFIPKGGVPTYGCLSGLYHCLLLWLGCTDVTRQIEVQAKWCFNCDALFWTPSTSNTIYVDTVAKKKALAATRARWFAASRTHDNNKLYVI